MILENISKNKTITVTNINNRPEEVKPGETVSVMDNTGRGYLISYPAIFKMVESKSQADENLRKENEKLKHENAELKKIIARLEGKDSDENTTKDDEKDPEPVVMPDPILDPKDGEDKDPKSTDDESNKTDDEVDLDSLDLKGLTSKYVELFEGKVPVSKKNNAEWIKETISKKLSETE